MNSVQLLMYLLKKAEVYERSCLVSFRFVLCRRKCASFSEKKELLEEVDRSLHG